MKHTEAQVLAKAHEVLKDLYQQFYNAEDVEGCHFIPEEEAIDFSHFTGNQWSISILDKVFDRYSFLTISDETGEPLYLQSSMVSGSEIILGEDMKYAYKSEHDKYDGSSSKKYVHKKKPGR